MRCKRHNLYCCSICLDSPPKVDPLPRNASVEGLSSIKYSDYWLFVNLRDFWKECPDDGIEIGRRLLKLNEEVGEVNGAFISYNDIVNKKSKNVTDIVNECADVQIILWDFLRKCADTYGYSQEEMEIMFHEGIQKGLDNFKKYLTKRDNLAGNITGNTKPLYVKRAT